MAIENLAPVGARPLLPAPVALPAANNGPAPALANDRLALSPVANQLSVVKPEMPGTYTVKPGDTLSAIARDQLGDANRWPEIYDLNAEQIENPDLIYPGQVLDLPEKQAAPSPKPAPAPAVMPPAPLPAPFNPPIGCFPAKPFPQQPKPLPVAHPPIQVGPGKPVGCQAGCKCAKCMPNAGQVRGAVGNQRSQLLQQKLELLQMEQRVVQLELALDRLLARLDDEPVGHHPGHPNCR